MPASHYRAGTICSKLYIHTLLMMQAHGISGNILNETEAMAKIMTPLQPEKGEMLAKYANTIQNKFVGYFNKQ